MDLLKIFKDRFGKTKEELSRPMERKEALHDEHDDNDGDLIEDQDATIGDDTVESVKLSDDLQMSIQGLPATLSPEQRAQILESLAKNTLKNLPERSYKKGENIYQGNARLKIHDRMHDISFSIEALRVLTALAVYKEAFDIVKTGVSTGEYDRELGDLTANFLKESAWQELDKAAQKQHKPRPKALANDEDVETEEELIDLSNEGEDA